jgi:RNA polymerase sigma-70 factor (ECF subfamily)
MARAHARKLAVVARREGLTAEDALDAVQEAFHTFLRLPQARTLVDDGEGTRALLTVLVRNAARNMRRRSFRSRPHEAIDDHAELADALPPADEVVARTEGRVALLGCVARLDEVQRNVVTLRMLEELSGEATAARLGLTPGHVAVLLHRAKKSLADCVGGLGHAPAPRKRPARSRRG